MARRSTDPELLRQLDEARSSGGSVAAVISVRRKRGVTPVPSAIEAQVAAAIERASKTSGSKPDDVHVMGRMAVAYVTGPEALIRELLAQPEVTGAVANSSDR